MQINPFWRYKMRKVFIFLIVIFINIIISFVLGYCVGNSIDYGFNKIELKNLYKFEYKTKR